MIATAVATDLIQCGDALWIGCSTWLVFWNGLIGALIGGVLAAAVAVFLLAKTNAHQASLASAEAIRQDNQAAAALKQQRETLELQLIEQRTGLEKQLEEQRTQASLDRQIAARAKLVDLLSQFSEAAGRGVPFDYAQLDRKIAMSIASWRMNLHPFDDWQMRSELSAWGGIFHEIEDALGLNDPADHGSVILNRVIGDMQKAALSYRDPLPKGQWTPENTPKFLREARKIGEEFYSARKGNIGHFFER